MALTIGDRVLVHGGYDGDESIWLAGGPGYEGTVIEIRGKWASVELDSPLTLGAAHSRWPYFGTGSETQLDTLAEARGRWLALALGWVEQEWDDDHLPRLQVGLCETMPDLAAIPEGGGIGAWVESHATITRL